MHWKAHNWLPITGRLGVLETWVLVSRRLETRFYKSWSWNLRVLVLEPSSLGHGLGLETWDHEDLVFVTHKAWNWDKIENCTLNYNDTTFKVLHTLLEKAFCPPATSAPVERIFSHSGLLMQANRARRVTTCCHSWSTCNATISCKFSCCCTVVISL